MGLPRASERSPLLIQANVVHRATINYSTYSKEHNNLSRGCSLSVSPIPFGINKDRM